jgi:ribonuclease PH
MNVVKTGRGMFVELQGTAEDEPFSGDELQSLMSAADKGIRELVAIQKSIVGDLPLKKEKPATP